MKNVWRIPHNEDIVFRCRKSGIGLAAAIGDGALFTVIIVVACIDLYIYTGIDFFIALMIVAILPIWYIIYEFLAWKAEVHIVSSYKHKEGGSYRKVTGPFSMRVIETAITRATPDISAELLFTLRVWEHCTGQGVMKIMLRSDGQSIIPSEFMPVGLYKAISGLKGEPPKRRPRDIAKLDSTSAAIRSALNDGIISKSKATLLMEALLQDEIL